MVFIVSAIFLISGCMTSGGVAMVQPIEPVIVEVLHEAPAPESVKAETAVAEAIARAEAESSAEAELAIVLAIARAEAEQSGTPEALAKVHALETLVVTPEPVKAEPVVAAPIAQKAPITQVAASKTYRIGETGPAGGIICYDKGLVSDGWRYLESAPAGWTGSAYDPKAQWGAYPFSLNGEVLETGLGKGLKNSEIIVAYNKLIQGNHAVYEQLPYDKRPFSEAYDGSVAAAICMNATINGFDDWYLPSQDELTFMRNNLYSKNLGSFQADLYWSSSMSGDRSGTMVNFWNGATGGAYTDNSYYIRPVRKF